MEAQKPDEKINKDPLKEFNENPYDPGKSKPEDIMRIFFINNVPIIPVTSKSGLLIGILRKEDLVSELSDIERVRQQKTDQFISKLTKKMTLDDLLPYVAKTREFTVINIFGEPQGRWSRLDLLEAAEKNSKRKLTDKEVEQQREEQVLEWIIYLILEHIPRALYALNQNGKTIFFNSHFEELYTNSMKSDIDVEIIEKSLNNPEKNDFFYRHKNEDIYFYNKDMDFYYEKVPLMNKDEKLGFLIFCDSLSGMPSSLIPSDTLLKDKPLQERLDFLERMIIVETLNECGQDYTETSRKLNITKQFLLKKMKKHDINC